MLVKGGFIQQQDFLGVTVQCFALSTDDTGPGHHFQVVAHPGLLDTENLAQLQDTECTLTQQAQDIHAQRITRSLAGGG